MHLSPLIQVIISLKITAHFGLISSTMDKKMTQAHAGLFATDDTKQINSDAAHKAQTDDQLQMSSRTPAPSVTQQRRLSWRQEILRRVLVSSIPKSPSAYYSRRRAPVPVADLTSASSRTSLASIDSFIDATGTAFAIISRRANV